MAIVGESNYQSALRRIASVLNLSGNSIEVDAELVREPQNPFDSNAVAVFILDEIVGYLPRDQALRVSNQMRVDGIQSASCLARIVCGPSSIGIEDNLIGVYLSAPVWDWIDFGLGKERPISDGSQKLSASGGKPSRPIAAASGPLKDHFIFIWGDSDKGSVAHELAGLGAHIMKGIGKSTTIVVQVQDDMSPGMKASSTYLRATERIREGANLEIVTLTELRKRLSKES